MFNYYGLDWLANVLFFIYVYLLGKGKPEACLWAIAGCVCQIIFSILAHSIGNAVCTTVFCYLYFDAYLKLKKREQNYSKKT